MKTTGTVVALVATLAAAGAQAQTSKTTYVRAPIVAVAIGPSSASVNVNTRSGNRTVYVGRPLIAVSTPFWQMHIKVN